MSTVLDFFEDAKALCDRAQHHYDEFNYLIGIRARPGLWEIKEEPHNEPDAYTYALHLNREVLRRVKPVAADAANNLVHSLDQLVGACARLRGLSRDRGLYFPWILREEEFERKLPALEGFIGSGMTAAIRNVRERHRLALPRIHAVKEVSNSGKHWQLIPSGTSSDAVAVTLPGGTQKIWEIPPNAFDEFDTYQFAVGVPRMANVPFHVVIRFEFEGLGEGVPATPDAVFDRAFAYVRDIIRAAEEVTDWSPPPLESRV